jgi:hypothetical protein
MRCVEASQVQSQASISLLTSLYRASLCLPASLHIFSPFSASVISSVIFLRFVKQVAGAQFCTLALTCGLNLLVTSHIEGLQLPVACMRQNPGYCILVRSQEASASLVPALLTAIFWFLKICLALSP